MVRQKDPGMTSKKPAFVKQLPRCQRGTERNSFLTEIKKVTAQSYRPRVILDLSKASRLGPETIDLLIDCVEHVERADGRVAVAAGSPEATVILELTRLDLVMDLFPSVSEAIGGNAIPHSAQHEGSEALAA
jgi:anti-anti-sigma regulatory factor